MQISGSISIINNRKTPRPEIRNPAHDQLCPAIISNTTKAGAFGIRNSPTRSINTGLRSGIRRPRDDGRDDEEKLRIHPRSAIKHQNVISTYCVDSSFSAQDPPGPPPSVRPSVAAHADRPPIQPSVPPSVPIAHRAPPRRQRRYAAIINFRFLINIDRPSGQLNSWTQGQLRTRGRMETRGWL